MELILKACHRTPPTDLLDFLPFLSCLNTIHTIPGSLPRTKRFRFRTFQSCTLAGNSLHYPRRDPCRLRCLKISKKCCLRVVNFSSWYLTIAHVNVCFSSTHVEVHVAAWLVLGHNPGHAVAARSDAKANPLGVFPDHLQRNSSASLGVCCKHVTSHLLDFIP